MSQGSSKDAIGRESAARAHRLDRAQVPVTRHGERYRSLFEHNLDAVFGLNPEGRFTEANSAAERLCGYSEAELRGMAVADLCAVEDRHAAMLFFARAMAGMPREVEVSAICKDGGAVDLLISGTPIMVDGAIVGIFCTARDTTSRRHAEAQLRRARRDAEQAKDQFLAVVSHELRTPLMPVLTAVQMLQTRSGIAIEFQDELAMMRRNLELEARLIDDLLDLNRIRQGKLVLAFRQIDLHQKVHAVVGLCQDEIDRKRLDLELDLEATEHHLGADPARLTQALFNVIGNAVRYTPEGGRIRVRTCNGVAGSKCHLDCHKGGRACKTCTPGSSFLSVHVTDTGIGISSEAMERLFGAFERGDRAHGHHGGRGVGLAISRALVELHGGMLVCHSEGPGRGATFTILLPLRNTCVIEPLPPDAAKSGTGHDNRSSKVLLVEDHVDTARVLAHLLRQNGYQTKVTGSVAAAREALDSEPYDLLISDIGLPDGSGTDVATYMRRTQHIPAIALSGYGMEEDIRRSRDAGFDEHLIKPINVAQLQQTMVRLLAAHSTASH